MNVTEASADGLRRKLKVVIGADELERRLSARLDELKGRARLKGFRPGRVPKDHLRKVYGRSVMAEVLQQAVAESSREAISQRDERPAFQPTVVLPEDQAEIDKIFSGASDLAYTLSFEVMPKIETMDFTKIALEKPVAPVTEQDIEKAIDRLRAANLRYQPKDGPAENGDRLVIDFVGKIDGEAFPGGSTEDAPILLGSGNFIPGFEEGLLGAKAGDEREVEATFPAEYQEASLAGKTAKFEVKVKEVGAPETPPLDEDFAKGLGLDSVDALRDMVKKRLEQDRAVASRQKLKRALLDALNEGHHFELPPTLVDNEFNAIWHQVTADLERTKRSFADEGTTEEKARADYREIAARRVRLGLVLSEVGQRSQIQVTDDEVSRALLERVRQFPGQERKVYDYYRNNPQLLAELRAPIFEDKVVDYILELAKIAERQVTPEELYADPDEDHDHHHGHDHDHHDHDHHDHAHHHHEYDHDHGHKHK
ncbi:trigger factor [Methyloceanibacter sp.]|uniref:trigger factor n=1 Tax=Methyloceanibacter sp. TaxID=1965321 RepID=UPI002D3F7CB5|nr:trigger factor [Methyloceanibacter sp.]HZP08953.1 trigger factor [Methyloceanibacter sp.]